MTLQKYLDRVLLDSGFIFDRKIDGNAAYSIPVSVEEVKAVFIPSVIYIKKEPVLMGVIGSVEVINGNDQKNEGLLFGCHTTNFRSLCNLNVFGADRLDDLEWLKKVGKVVKQFPTSKSEFSRMVREGVEIDHFPVRKMIFQNI